MIGYILKGPFIALLVLVLLVGVGAGAGALVYSNLGNSVNDAGVRGYEEGYSTGYNEGLKEGSEAGYQEGSKVGLLEASGEEKSDVSKEGYYFLYNPTYDEMLLSLTKGQLNSAKDILDFAEANGMRAAYVRVPIAREAREGRVYLYQLVGFDTVDRGFVIIEPRSHRGVKVEVGQSYSRLNGFPVSPYDDTITSVTVVW